MKKSAQLFLGLFVIFVTLLMLPFSAALGSGFNIKVQITFPMLTASDLNHFMGPSISTDDITGNADCVYSSTDQPAYARIKMNALPPYLRPIRYCVTDEQSDASLSSDTSKVGKNSLLGSGSNCSFLPILAEYKVTQANATSYTIDKPTYQSITNANVTNPFVSTPSPIGPTMSSAGVLTTSITFNAGSENADTKYPIPWASAKTSCSDPYYKFQATYDFAKNLCHGKNISFVPGSGSCSKNICTFTCLIKPS